MKKTLRKRKEGEEEEGEEEEGEDEEDDDKVKCIPLYRAWESLLEDKQSTCAFRKHIPFPLT